MTFSLSPTILNSPVVVKFAREARCERDDAIVKLLSLYSEVKRTGSPFIVSPLNEAETDAACLAGACKRIDDGIEVLEEVIETDCLQVAPSLQ